MLSKKFLVMGRVGKLLSLFSNKPGFYKTAARAHPIIKMLLKPS
jgi:hypothetical protein